MIEQYVRRGRPAGTRCVQYLPLPRAVHVVPAVQSLLDLAGRADHAGRGRLRHPGRAARPMPRARRAPSWSPWAHAANDRADEPPDVARPERRSCWPMRGMPPALRATSREPSDEGCTGIVRRSPRKIKGLRAVRQTRSPRAEPPCPRPCATRLLPGRAAVLAASLRPLVRPGAPVRPAVLARAGREAGGRRRAGAVLSRRRQPAPEPGRRPRPARRARRARIYSKARFAWIQPEPRPSRGWLGYLGLGGSVALRGGSVEKARAGRRSGGGCEAWYAVEPRGLRLRGRHGHDRPRGSGRPRARRGRAQDRLPLALRLRRVAGRAALRQGPEPRRAAPGRVGPRRAPRARREGARGRGQGPVARRRRCLGRLARPVGRAPDPASLVELGPLVREPRRCDRHRLDGRLHALLRASAAAPSSSRTTTPSCRRIACGPTRDPPSTGVELVDDDHALPARVLPRADRPKYRREAGRRVRPDGRERGRASRRWA